MATASPPSSLAGGGSRIQRHTMEVTRLFSSSRPKARASLSLGRALRRVRGPYGVGLPTSALLGPPTGAGTIEGVKNRRRLLCAGFLVSPDTRSVGHIQHAGGLVLQRHRRTGGRGPVTADDPVKSEGRQYGSGTCQAGCGQNRSSRLYRIDTTDP